MRIGQRSESKEEVHQKPRTKTVNTPPWRTILILRVEATPSRTAGPETSARLHPLPNSYLILPAGQSTFAVRVGRRDAPVVCPAHPFLTGRANIVRPAGVAVWVPDACDVADGRLATVVACGLMRVQLGFPPWDSNCRSEGDRGEHGWFPVVNDQKCGYSSKVKAYLT